MMCFLACINKYDINLLCVYKIIYKNQHKKGNLKPSVE